GKPVTLTRDVALEEWKRFRDEVMTGPAAPPPEPLTFGRYVELHWKDIIRSASERTRRGYAVHMNHIILPELGPMLLEKVNPATLRDLAGRMKDGENVVATGKPKAGGYSANTINHCAVLVRRVLLDAVDRGDLPRYPFLRREKKEKPVLLKLELNPEEREAFLASFDDEQGFRRLWTARRDADAKRRAEVPGRPGGPWEPTGEAVAFHFERLRASYPFFAVALETGLRRGDLLELRWTSIDLREGVVIVQMRKTKEEAVIPMSGRLRDALNVLRFGAADDGYVFESEVEIDGQRRRQRWSWTVLERYFRLAKTIAGITRRFRFHDIRHSFCSTMVSAGVPLEVLQKMTGHTTLQMLQRYARPDLATLRRAMATAEMSRGMSIKPVRMDRGAAS
ncbi:MAG TPA: tyrosine-type recombinase/integrase, partial [Thermoanaerobaculia bacterium]|nr:tyrosine-type recombinase/integrase [Thermoanaerobaculia bacterium]